MGGEDTAANASAGAKKRKADSTPPDGYVCRLCSTPGHWIQVCPTKKTGTKRQRKSDHVPVPGKDPSEEDIERARELQKIPPPKCFCGLTSRLNKVKRSKEGGDTSRAIGKYFFFCSKKRDDETQCRFARPVEMELNKKGKKGGTVDKKANKKKNDGKEKQREQNKSGNEKKSKLICKFFAKNGSCKKGKNCGFSHDVGQAKKEAENDQHRDKKQQISARDEKDNDESSSDDSSSSTDSNGSEKEDGDGEKRKDDTSSDSNSSSSSDGESD